MSKKRSRSIDFILIILILGLLLILGGCSEFQEQRKQWTFTTSDSLPRNPKHGQVFNNSWIYNSAVGAWILGSGGYRYYPKTDSYTDVSGKAITPPRSVSLEISEGIKAREKKVIPTVKKTSKKYTRRKSRTRVHRMHRPRF